MENRKRQRLERKELNTSVNSCGDGGQWPQLSPPSEALSKSSAIHGSMENIHRPKNYRRRGFTPSPKTRKILNSDPSTTGPGSEGGTPRQGQRQNAAAVLADSSALYKYIEEEKTKIIVRKAVTSLLYGALKKQSARVNELEVQRQRKTEESAARLILHNLLLNSWRTARIDLERLTKENAQLSISVRVPL
jgi:hypothetical protein